MAETDKLPPQVLNGIAGQIRSRLAAVGVGNGLSEDFESLTAAESTSQGLELAETFSLWTLGTDDIVRFKQTGADLADLARETGRWHHQLKSPKGPVGFARSLSPGADPEKTSVRDVFFSELSALINRAIRVADEVIPDNRVARLLSVPAYQVHAFWFVNQDPADDYHDQMDVLIIDAPGRLKLKPRSFLSARDFLSTLASEDHIRGLI